jgi:hypothetical protein
MVVVVAMNLFPIGASRTTRGGLTIKIGFEPGIVLRDALDPSYEVTVEPAGCLPGAGEGCVSLEIAARGVRVMLDQPQSFATSRLALLKRPACRDFRTCMSGDQ